MLAILKAMNKSSGSHGRTGKVKPTFRVPLKIASLRFSVQKSRLYPLQRGLPRIKSCRLFFYLFVAFAIARVGIIYVDRSKKNLIVKNSLVASTSKYARREGEFLLQDVMDHHRGSAWKKTRQLVRGGSRSAGASNAPLQSRAGTTGGHRNPRRADELELQTAEHEPVERVAREDSSEKLVDGDTSQGHVESMAVLVVAYNRPDYLRQTLDSLAKVSRLSDISVYVSQDGFDEGVARVASEGQLRGLGKPQTRGYEHWQRERIPQLGQNQPGHAWLAQHYKWAIDKIFIDRAHSHVIIVEDDMLFSPDFLVFFKQTAHLLARDESLWCISTWNDNGLASHARDPLRLFRTSYFPGLGWMMRRELWNEIGSIWPKEHWDHWMRLNTTSKGRECIVPEVNRNFNIGRTGANMRRDTYERYLKRMSFNVLDINHYGNLAYLDRDVYRQRLQRLTQSAVVWPWHQHQHSIISSLHHWLKTEKGDNAGENAVLALYRMENYELLANALDLWPYPRGHSQHAIEVSIDGVTIILADERSCPYLPSHLRVRPSRGLTPVAAVQGQTCDAACRYNHMKCHAPDFWFLNSCEVLAKFFPCEAGCALVLGDDIPNYVVSNRMDTYQKCLVSERQATCAASHRATTRLCACVPST